MSTVSEQVRAYIYHRVNVEAVIHNGSNRGQIVADDGPEVAHGPPPFQTPPPQSYPAIPANSN